MFLGVETDDERGNIDNLLSDTVKVSFSIQFTQYGRNTHLDIPNVTLADENTGVMYRLGQAELVDLSL